MSPLSRFHHDKECVRNKFLSTILRSKLTANGTDFKTINPKEYMPALQLENEQINVFTVLNGSGHVKLDLTPSPAVAAYLKRVAARPAVHIALIAEDLMKAAA